MQQSGGRKLNNKLNRIGRAERHLGFFLFIYINNLKT